MQPKTEEFNVISINCFPLSTDRRFSDFSIHHCNSVAYLSIPFWTKKEKITQDKTLKLEIADKGL